MSIFSNEAAEGIEESTPFSIFAEWMKEARSSESADPEACALASADANGCPNVRMVLVREVSERGFVFNTNLESVKGVELRENPHTALCFHWKSLERQVRVLLADRLDARHVRGEHRVELQPAHLDAAVGEDHDVVVRIRSLGFKPK